MGILTLSVSYKFMSNCVLFERRGEIVFRDVRYLIVFGLFSFYVFFIFSVTSDLLCF